MPAKILVIECISKIHKSFLAYWQNSILNAMPNFEEHCQSTLKKLGCRFESVHRWMDELSEVMGANHRVRRHDPFETPEQATKIFSKDYPNHSDLIKEAVLDHILLDSRNGVRVREAREIDRCINGLLKERSRLQDELSTCRYYWAECVRDSQGFFSFLTRRSNEENIRSWKSEVERVEREIADVDAKIADLEASLKALHKGKEGSAREEKHNEEQQEEEPDFASEDNLEAQGIPSSAEMDLEDSEEG